MTKINIEPDVSREEFDKLSLTVEALNIEFIALKETVEKTSKGFQIRSEKTGKLFPKVYKSKGEAQKRVDQMKAFKESDNFEILEIMAEALHPGSYFRVGSKKNKKKMNPKKFKSKESAQEYLEQIKAYNSVALARGDSDLLDLEVLEFSNETEELIV